MNKQLLYSCFIIEVHLVNCLKQSLKQSLYNNAYFLQWTRFWTLWTIWTAHNNKVFETNCMKLASLYDPSCKLYLIVCNLKTSHCKFTHFTLSASKIFSVWLTLVYFSLFFVGFHLTSRFPTSNKSATKKRIAWSNWLIHTTASITFPCQDDVLHVGVPRDNKGMHLRRSACMRASTMYATTTLYEHFSWFQGAWWW